VLVVTREITDGPRYDEKRVTTTPSKQDPWAQLEPQTGVVPGHWVRDLLTSNQVFAFEIHPELPRAIIPTTVNGRLEEAPEDLSPFWERLNAAYDELRGRGRNTPETLIAQLDHNGKLSVQLTRAGTRRTLVLYPKSGDIMRGARIRTGPIVVDDTLYYFSAASVGEAGFLTALLNAPSLSRAFQESRTSGRDFHQHPWRVIPIPRYDATDAVHRDLASLCNRAERATGEWLAEQTRPYGQIAASTRIRDLLNERGIFAAIDRAAAAILPAHAEV